jgi:hypothetical protein
MQYNESLFEELKYKNKNRLKKVYSKKEYSMIKNNNIAVSKSADDMIRIKVGEISKKISSKYHIEEEKIYDDLYLKVRKMFLELL